MEKRIDRSWHWRLNNYLLESPGSREIIEKEMEEMEFFQWNTGSAFKAYIRGILISIKSVRQKTKSYEKRTIITSC